MPDDFVSRAVATLETSSDADSIVVAVVGPDGNLVVDSRSDRPRHLAQVAACLAGEVAERVSIDAHANLHIACVGAETRLRDALDGEG